MHFTRDGTRLAYRLFGPSARGERASAERFVLCDGISCDGFIWKDLGPHLSERFDVLHVNYRGHGRSGLPRDPQATTLAHLASDLVAVMDAVGFEDGIFLGHSLGVQVSLETAIRAPTRVRGGGLFCGSYGRVLDTFKHTDIGARVLPVFDKLTQHFRGAVTSLVRGFLGSPAAYALAALTEIKGDRVKPRDLQPYLDHFARMPIDLFTTLLGDASERTSLPQLPRLTQPFLVVAGQDDGFTPLFVSKIMAQALPHARLVVVPGTSHVAPLEAPTTFRDALDGFVAELPPRRSASALAWPAWPRGT